MGRAPRQVHRVPPKPSRGARGGVALAALVAGLALSAVPRPAAAQATADDRLASQEFSEGERAFNLGDFRLAAEKFEAAYRHKPHYAPLWNAARSRHRSGGPGDQVRAANLYTRYLSEAPPKARNRAEAEAAVQKLAPKLGRLEITAVGFENVSVDREPATLTEGRFVYVSPGAHLVEAKVAGSDKTVTTSTSVEAGQTQSVLLAPPKQEPPQPVQVVKDPENPTHNDEEDEHRDVRKPRKEGGGGLSPVFAYVGIGLTVALGVATTASGVDVQNQLTTWKRTPTQSVLDSGRSKEVRTNVLLGATIGTAVLTGVVAVWLVDWKSGDTNVQAGAGLGNLTIRGTF